MSLVAPARERISERSGPLWGRAVPRRRLSAGALRPNRTAMRKHADRREYFR